MSMTMAQPNPPFIRDRFFVLSVANFGISKTRYFLHNNLLFSQLASAFLSLSPLSQHVFSPSSVCRPRFFGRLSSLVFGSVKGSCTCAQGKQFDKMSQVIWCSSISNLKFDKQRRCTPINFKSFLSEKQWRNTSQYSEKNMLIGSIVKENPPMQWLVLWKHIIGWCSAPLMQ